MGAVTTFQDRDFRDKWAAKFEDAFEKISESQVKRKLFPPEQMRSASLRIAKNIWAVNAAQGAIFSQMGANTILLSTEKRARDQNYVINSETAQDFPPVLYILSAAEKWNRKLTAGFFDII